MANQNGFARSNFSNKNNFDGGLIHFGVSRYRVTGSGNLQLSLNTLDDIRIATLPSIPMAVTTEIEPTVICNFVSQRACLVFQTTNINEVFTISRITIFVKQVATGIPQ